MKAALDKAVATHGALTKAALTGKGWDRQLFALQKLAQERGISHPIFEDKVGSEFGCLFLFVVFSPKCVQFYFILFWFFFSRVLLELIFVATLFFDFADVQDAG